MSCRWVMPYKDSGKISIVNLGDKNALDRSAAAHVMELAEQLKTHAPLTMRSIKTLLRRIRESRPQVEDHDIIAEVYTSADFKEGMDAFLNKRKPNWQGR